MPVEVSTEQALPKAQAGATGTSAANEPELERQLELQLNEERWRPLLRLPCLLTVELPLPEVKIADFLQLRIGSVVRTNWQAVRDVPLRVNGALIGWSEFEVVGNRLAVRVTELA